MKKRTDLLLSISIATTDMQRAVSMFPEVYFMDVIATPNCQKRDLFLLVVKDASGETNVGNLSLLPCGKTWIFTQLYRHFLRFLYGEQTLSRNRLAMTDDDTASHGAFDCSSSVMPSLALSKNMLCTFHSIVMKYQEVVYPALPKKKGTKILTNAARVYGKPYLYYEDAAFVCFRLAG